MKRLSLVGIVVLGCMAGCSLPAVEGRSFTATRTAKSASIDPPTTPAPIVDVRGFSHSAVVSVVAWDEDDAEFGLRTSVTRSGELVGGVRFGDHRLYVTPQFVRANGGFKYATDTLGHLLVGAGRERDIYACFYGTKCSPLTTLGVRIPDSLLRATRDTLIVMFVPTVGENWTIALRHELIAAYLTKVDSVVADMRKATTK